MATYKKRGDNKNTKKTEKIEKSTVAEVFENLDKGASTSEQWVFRNQKIIFGTFVGIVVIALAFFGYTKYIKDPKEIEALKMAKHSESIFEEANQENTIRTRDSLLKLALEGDDDNMGLVDIAAQYSGTNVANLVNYKVGTGFYNLRKYNEAIAYLQNFNSNDDMLLGALSLMTIGDSFVQLDQLEEGLAYYKKTIAYSNNNLSSPIALFKAGQVALELKEKQKALDFFKLIKTQYPNSEEARTIDIYIQLAS